MQFHVENMTCGGCARAVTKAVQTIDADATVEATPKDRTVVVTSEKPRDAFVPALEAAGFPPTPA